MDDVMLILVLTCLALLFAGLVQPTLFKPLFKTKISRGRISILFGSLSFLFFILFGLTNDNKINSPTTSENSAISLDTSYLKKPKKLSQSNPKKTPPKAKQIDYSN